MGRANQALAVGDVFLHLRSSALHNFNQLSVDGRKNK